MIGVCIGFERDLKGVIVDVVRRKTFSKGKTKIIKSTFFSRVV